MKQPIASRVLLSDDAQPWYATECATCLTVIGPEPQEPHSLADCIHALAKVATGSPE